MERKDILKKLKAFSERTIENGCTEAEALAAAKAMQGLQNKYNLTLTELDIELTEYVKGKISLGHKVKHPVWLSLFGLQTFCEVKIVSNGARITILGQQHKVDNAIYMIGLLQSAMEVEYSIYKRSADYDEQRSYYHSRSIRSSFMQGMAMRLSKRLLEMFEQNRREVVQPKTTDGVSLIVLADTALEEAYRKEWPRLGSAGSVNRARSSGAAAAGRSAANRVGLNSGVGGGRSMGLLT